METKALSKPKTYFVTEIFYSVQGEGTRAGIPHVFVRFGRCNLRCSQSSEGFECDTDFSSGTHMTEQEIVEQINVHHCDQVLLTGGEPLLQLDVSLICTLVEDAKLISVETNGTLPLPTVEGDQLIQTYDLLDWVTVSPKTAEHTLRVQHCDEVKYVRCAGQQIPRPQSEVLRTCPNKLISPACQPDGNFLPEDVSWCVDLVKKNPLWRLSLQTHKLMRIR